jgi:DNA invertase Pin-like site-specific DNA recombinase
LSAKGFELAAVYEDLNRSGMRLSDRPGLDALLAALDHHTFDQLVVDDLQCLARGGTGLLNVLERLRAAGVTLHCVNGPSKIPSIDQQASYIRKFVTARGWKVVCA